MNKYLVPLCKGFIRKKFKTRLLLSIIGLLLVSIFLSVVLAQVKIEIIEPENSTENSEEIVIVNKDSVQIVTEENISDDESETNIVQEISSIPMSATRTQAFLRQPFQGDYALGNVFDHAYPFPFEDTGGHQLSFWGDSLKMGYDGHRGYDWKLPKNTQVLATADGVVVEAGVQRPFYCSLYGGYTKSQISVLLRHDRPEGVFYSYYSHLSGVQVSVGAKVTAGQLIAYSGDSGCSDSFHLHFEILKQKGREKITVDPYGWQAPYHDPWQQHSDGAESEVLWIEGYAPKLFREAKLDDGFSTDVPVFIRSVRYFGGIHNEDVEGEVVRLELSPNHTRSYNLSDFTLKNEKGLNYTFPEGSTIQPNQPIFVHSKAGQNTQINYYMNKTQAVWSEQGDCARLLRPNGYSMFQFTYMKYRCN